MTPARAEIATQRIIDELTNRKGLRHVIDNFDEEIMTEIHEAITAIILTEAEKVTPDGK